jgi:predicted O-methyltransferase YrrM
MPLLRYNNLMAEVAKRKPHSIMEIGTWNGIHASEMFLEAKKYNDNVIYYGFDLFEIRDEKINKEEHNVKTIQTLEGVKSLLISRGINFALFQGFSRDTIPTFEPDVPVDFLYIDGGHSVQTIFDDWNNCQRLINKNTVVIFDDYYHHRNDTGCNQVIDSIDREEYNVEFLNPIDYTKGGQSIQFVKATRR